MSQTLATGNKEGIEDVERAELIIKGVTRPSVGCSKYPACDVDEDDSYDK